LNGCNAEREKAGKPFACQLDEVCPRCLAHLPNRRIDAAAACRDLLIRQTAKSGLELVLSTACEKKVRMTVNEPGQDGLARGIKNVCLLGQRRQFAGGTDPHDGIVLDDDGSIADDGEIAQLCSGQRALSL